ncbi:hypothetical protein SRABI26_04281 [Arthrobacter sp. Bi26]|nr:hypothetical protein SRABI26_04281 [Arthrobacter sp. Bi26]
MTLPGYVLALCILLGSLVLLSAVFYGLLRLRRRRQGPASVPQRQES